MKKRKNTKFDILLYFIFIVLCILILIPFYNVVILSVANTITYAKHTPYILPFTVDFSGFKEILKDPFFIKSLSVTLFVTIVGTTLNMIFSTLTAYVISRRKLLGRKFILNFIIFTMLFSGGTVPIYLIVTKLGLLNSIWSMILPCLLNTYYIIIMKNYFQSLPRSLEEAAIIDGANDLQVLTRVYLPISKPFMATFALFYSVERWNEWWHAYLYISDKNLKPLQIYLKDLLVVYDSQLAPQLKSLAESQMKIFPQSVQMSTILITMIPIICLYPFVQKYFVKGVMMGSLKE
ncbi:carbohydrate ABC transporter permease [Tissierella creatinophila]|uniref:L-arabinose transport system permease protein AraQ n=1 Tax=Tissierella creatinophila DSM 6911 TaxID=1123403 RepID=A0A1U7M7B5_TISCR|nr:carbohydrate ABC transporter permease [Tissierella creatinophila]OLS03176.1 L-arabinose transport system permease protein AraQ [Tissierella creatinophila DSM 6911]